METRQKVVADTSALLAVCLQEETRQAVIKETKGVDLIAPESLSVEIPNALSSHFKRGTLTLEEAMAVIQRFENIPIQQVPIDPREATRLAHALDIYAYDAYVIDTAQRHSCPILTLDRGLSQAARHVGVNVIDI